MYEVKTDALRGLLDPAAVAAWLDEVDSHRTTRPRAPAPAPTPSVSDPRLLTVNELCERLRVKRSWVYEQVRQDAIPHVRVGRYIRFSWPQVEEWLGTDR